MKKLIGLSLAICLMVAMVSGFSALAAFTPTDINFDDMTFDINTETAEGAAILNNATGWTLNNISGTASVSTVTATDENAEWTGRGKILKISGGASNGDLKITVPNSYTYDNDKWVLEYDLYVTSFAGKINVFGQSNFNLKSVGTYGYYADAYNFARFYNNNTIGTAGYSQLYYIDGVWGKWYKWTYVFDNLNTVDGTFSLPTVTNGSDSRPISNLPTLTVYKTDLETGVKTQVAHKPTLENNHSGNLLLGGNTYTNKTDNPTPILKDTFYIDNLKIYTVGKFGFESSADDEATGYDVDKEYVEFTMNKAVAPASVATVTVSGVDSATAAVMADGKTVRVTFNEDLAFGTTYTVDFSGLTDSEGTLTESAKKTITFSTRTAPALYFAGSSLYKGVGAYAAPTAAVSADDIYAVEATVKSTAASASQGTIICAIYNANGALVDTILVSKSVAAGAEEKIATGLTVPTGAAGGEVRVYLWNDMTSMAPYVKPIAFGIAAAQ